ncbi:universal stress protein [Frigoriglobus tundricola]|uniref:UspA domain-containing protein n=1 Tax=Frigoriglobus tundricola TaxID=2774151 RepID=A0A6M5YM03_9BACT|nr:universal stress protein [Frigoriglobus tundricola]QJW94978.1 hypothetical protein FTUN_2504 [Frigoriglobus tundricola]
MFQTVLIPIDGSEFGEAAVPWAVAAAAAGAALHLVHAHGFPPVEAGVVCDPTLDRALLAHEERYLDQLVARVRAAAPQLVIAARTTDVCLAPADALRAAVREIRPDLVVMATHGRGPLGRFFLGSVSDQMAQRSPVPVLLVRAPGATGAERPRLEELVVPLDGSPFAEQILGPAAALAAAFGCRSTLVCVADPATDRTGQRAEWYLEQVARSRPGGVISWTVVRGESAAASVLSVAGGDPNTGIALATHGRTGLGRLLHGSVADEVIRHAAGPVLVYHPTNEGP